MLYNYSLRFLFTKHTSYNNVVYKASKTFSCHSDWGFIMYYITVHYGFHIFIGFDFKVFWRKHTQRYRWLPKQDTNIIYLTVYYWFWPGESTSKVFTVTVCTPLINLINW